MELFQPWYAQALVQFIIRHHSKRRPNQPLSIVEIGGGQGTLAKGILVCDLTCSRVFALLSWWLKALVTTACEKLDE